MHRLASALPLIYIPSLVCLSFLKCISVSMHEFMYTHACIVPRDRGLSDKLGLGWQFVSYHLSDRKAGLGPVEESKHSCPWHHAPAPSVFAAVVLNSTYYRGGEKT